MKVNQSEKKTLISIITKVSCLQSFEKKSNAFNDDEATMSEILRIFETYDARLRPHMDQTLNITGSVLQYGRRFAFDFGLLFLREPCQNIVEFIKSKHLCWIYFKAQPRRYAIRYGCLFQTILERSSIELVNFH